MRRKKSRASVTIRVSEREEFRLPGTPSAMFISFVSRRRRALRRRWWNPVARIGNVVVAACGDDRYRDWRTTVGKDYCIVGPPSVGAHPSRSLDEESNGRRLQTEIKRPCVALSSVDESQDRRRVAGPARRLVQIILCSFTVFRWRRWKRSYRAPSTDSAGSSDARRRFGGERPDRRRP